MAVLVELFVLLVVTIAGSFSAENDGAVYSKKVDEVTFGTMSSLEQPADIDEAVWHLEIDNADDQRVIMADGSALKSFNYNRQQLQQNTIVGSSQRHGYREGIYPDSLFDTITGFVQVNWTHILVVDSKNHCLRFVDRSKQSTTLYSGRCQSSGHMDGSLLAARFNRPMQIVLMPNHVVAYLTDSNNMAIREIDLSTETVSTWADLSHRPIAIALVHQAKDIYVSTPADIVKFKLDDGSRQPFLRSSQVGFQDGSFAYAKINNIQSIIGLSRDVVIAAEPRNNRLRVFNTQSQTVTSICNGNSDFSDSTASIENCELEQPLSMVFVQRHNVILIGANTTDMRALSLKRARILGGGGTGRTPKPETSTSGENKNKKGENNVDTVIVVASVITGGVVLLAVIIAVVLLLHRKWKARKHRQSGPTAHLDLAVANSAIQNEKSGQPGERKEIAYRNSNPYDDYTEMEDTYHTIDYNEIGLHYPLRTTGEKENAGNDAIFSGSKPSLTKSMSRKEDYGYLDFSKDDSTHVSIKSEDEENEM